MRHVHITLYGEVVPLEHALKLPRTDTEPELERWLSGKVTPQEAYAAAKAFIESLRAEGVVLRTLNPLKPVASAEDVAEDYVELVKRALKTLGNLGKVTYGRLPTLGNQTHSVGNLVKVTYTSLPAVGNLEKVLVLCARWERAVRTASRVVTSTLRLYGVDARVSTPITPDKVELVKRFDKVVIVTHGLPDRLLCDAVIEDGRPVLKTFIGGDNAEVLRDKLVYAVACETAKVLGRVCGALEYAGFEADVIFPVTKHLPEHLDFAAQYTLAPIAHSVARYVIGDPEALEPLLTWTRVEELLSPNPAIDLCLIHNARVFREIRG